MKKHALRICSSALVVVSIGCLIAAARLNMVLEAASRLIIKTPGVCGGEACLRNRRVPVWLLVNYRAAGMPDEAIRAAFGVTQIELDAAWQYAAEHPTEIDQIRLAND